MRQFNNAASVVDRSHTLATISAWAFCSERLMHGTPSGLDNTICTYGQLVKFYKQQPPQTVGNARPCDILLVDSAVARSTLVQVQRVAALHERHPRVVDAILEAMDAVVEDLLPLLTTTTGADGGDDEAGDFERLACLVELNGSLLRALGVSHERLEAISRICAAHGVPSKLTGAGGGGFAFAVLPPHCGDTAAKLGEALSAAGFVWHRTTVGGAGVIVEDLTEGGSN